MLSHFRFFKGISASAGRGFFESGAKVEATSENAVENSNAATSTDAECSCLGNAMGRTGCRLGWCCVQLLSHIWNLTVLSIYSNRQLNTYLKPLLNP